MRSKAWVCGWWRASNGTYQDSRVHNQSSPILHLRPDVSGCASACTTSVLLQGSVLKHDVWLWALRKRRDWARGTDRNSAVRGCVGSEAEAVCCIQGTLPRLN